jgi:hypothetical protein
MIKEELFRRLSKDFDLLERKVFPLLYMDEEEFMEWLERTIERAKAYSKSSERRGSKSEISSIVMQIIFSAFENLLKKYRVPGVLLYYKDIYFIISKRPFEKWADYDIVGFVEKLYGGRENIVDWV